MNKRWLKYHLKVHDKKTISKSRHHNTVLVDGNKGLYCSSKNLSGRAVPIHVIKKTSGKEPLVFCENLTCIYEKQTAERGGNVSYECDHVKSIEHAIAGKVIDLDIAVLDQLVESGFISSSRKALVLDLKASSSNSDSPFVVEVPNLPDASSRYLNLSVYSSVQRYWSRIDRTIVTVDLKSHLVSCRCSADKRCCTHKAVAK